MASCFFESQKKNKLTDINCHVLKLSDNMLFAHEELEGRLNFPCGVLSIWQYALEKKLSRNCVWDLSSINHPKLRQAAEFASLYYKRGVSLLGVKKQPKLLLSPKKTEVNFVSELCFAAKHKQDVFYVVDPSVDLLWSNINYSQAPYFPVEVSEATKNLQSLSQIIHEWQLRSCPKTLIVIGGGILIDMCAFVASIFNLNLEVYPSTLLAMVDVAISGKTGVNVMPYGKNMLGSFYFPKAVRIYPPFLKTLSQKNILSGAAECIKHALIIDDQKLLADLIGITRQESSIDTIHLLLPKLIKVKNDIIQKDPFEQNIRMYLNLGHTLAHALEALSQKNVQTSKTTISHGEAVMIGLVFCVIVSRELSLISFFKYNSIIQAFKKSCCLLPLAKIDEYLQTNIKDLKSWQLLIPYLKQDKKQLGSNKKSFLWVVLYEQESSLRKKMRCRVVQVSFKILQNCWSKLYKVLDE